MRHLLQSLKKNIAPTLIIILLISSLTGCSSQPQQDLSLMHQLNNGEPVEIVVVQDDAAVEMSASTEKQAYEWQVLAALRNHEKDFRVHFDKALDVTFVTIDGKDTKNGPMYINSTGQQDDNTAFIDSLRNKVFVDKLKDDDIKAELVDLARSVYTDVEGQHDALYASLGLYYNLFSEYQNGNTYAYCPSDVLNRGEFMSVVYRANNPVSDITSEVYKDAYGDSEHGAYAEQLDAYAWLNAENKGLTTDTYQKPITKLEAHYLLTKLYFGSETPTVDAIDGIKSADLLTKPTKVLTADFVNTESGEEPYNAGIIFGIGSNGAESDVYQKTADAWQLGVLVRSLEENELHTGLYDTLRVAKSHGIDVSDWNTTVSKTDAIELLVTYNMALNESQGYSTQLALGEMPEQEEIAIENEVVDEEDGTVSGYVGGDIVVMDIDADIDITDEEYAMICAINACKEELKALGYSQKDIEIFELGLRIYAIPAVIENSVYGISDEEERIARQYGFKDNLSHMDKSFEFLDVVADVYDNTYGTTLANINSNNEAVTVVDQTPQNTPTQVQPQPQPQQVAEQPTEQVQEQPQYAGQGYDGPELGKIIWIDKVHYYYENYPEDIMTSLIGGTSTESEYHFTGSGNN